LTKILAVCGMGLGSGLLVRMQVEKVLKQAGIEATVEVTDISSARGPASGVDIIVTTEELAPQLGSVKAKVIPLRNLLDLNELREKLIPIIQSL
jgi:ascorbate PTS system EIIB component